MKRNNFSKACVRKDVLKEFENDACILNKFGENRSILLSFTTDPYQPLNDFENLTRKAITILHFYDLKVSILTKGGKRSVVDFDLLSSRPELSQYGTTLVFTDEKLRSEIEPCAAPTEERIQALEKAHELEIPTFVSLEPVWDPDQTLDLIESTNEFVDYYKVGKLNYNQRQNLIDWKHFRESVMKKLDLLNKDYYIKKDLMVY
jgi:DNA repair photolyase